MECYGSRENILKAKLEILEGLNKNGTVIINYDNDLLHNWYEKEKQNYNIITYGLNKQSNIIGQNALLHENGSECEAIVKGEKYKLHIPVGGEHFVQNSLCAIAVAQALNIEMSKAIEGIASFELTKRRMEIKKAKNGATIINDYYNANYDSMKAALDYLGKLPNSKKIAVLGDMLELGEYSKELHEKVGEIVANNKINILICVGEDSKYIVQKAQEQGMNKSQIYWCKNNNEAIGILQKEMKKQDVVLLKASNCMHFAEISDAIQ